MPSDLKILGSQRFQVVNAARQIEHPPAMLALVCSAGRRIGADAGRWPRPRPERRPVVGVRARCPGRRPGGRVGVHIGVEYAMGWPSGYIRASRASRCGRRVGSRLRAPKCSWKCTVSQAQPAILYSKVRSRRHRVLFDGFAVRRSSIDISSRLAVAGAYSRSKRWIFRQVLYNSHSVLGHQAPAAPAVLTASLQAAPPAPGRSGFPAPATVRPHLPAAGPGPAAPAPCIALPTPSHPSWRCWI